MALEAIRGDLTLAELGAKHGIHHTMIAAWKTSRRDPHAAQHNRKCEPCCACPIMPRPSVEKGQCANEGRGLVPAMEQVEGEGQVLAPVPPGLLGDPGLPRREGGEGCRDRLEVRPTWKL